MKSCHILPRAALGASAGRLWPASSVTAGLAAPHGSGYTALLFRSELENIIHEQLGVILIVTLE
jgi:hypothetical protein